MKKIVFLLSVAIFSQIGYAKTIEEYVQSKGEEGFYKATKIDRVKGSKRGEGPGPYLPALGELPKKVGLISVYLKDLGKQSSKNYLALTVSSISHLPNSTGNALTGLYLQETIPVLKEEFQSRGSELLTPVDFLDTSEKISFYENFEPELGKIIKTGMKWHSNALSLSGAPILAHAPGYRLFPMDLFMNDKKAANSMKKICDELGLDAVMGIVVETRTTNKVTELMQMNISMFGPNPVPEKQRKGMAFLMYEGQPYGTASLRKLKSNLFEYKKGAKLKTENDISGNANSGFIHTTTTYYEKLTTYASVTGMDVITKSMMRKLLDRLERDINK